MLAGCPYFLWFSQIVDHLRLRFACVTDVRDSSTGLPARRSGADVSAAQGPVRQGQARSVGPASQGPERPEPPRGPERPEPEYSGYGPPDPDQLARRQPATGPFARLPGSPPS